MMSGSCNPVPQCPGLRHPRSFHRRAAQESDLSTRGLNHESKRYKIYKEISNFFSDFFQNFQFFGRFFSRRGATLALLKRSPRSGASKSRLLRTERNTRVLTRSFPMFSMVFFTMLSTVFSLRRECGICLNGPSRCTRFLCLGCLVSCELVGCVPFFPVWCSKVHLMLFGDYDMQCINVMCRCLLTCIDWDWMRWMNLMKRSSV